MKGKSQDLTPLPSRDPLAQPDGVAVSPDDSLIYVVDQASYTLSAFYAKDYSRVPNFPLQVGAVPIGVTIKPDGSRIYVTNYGGNSVSVINPAVRQLTVKRSVTYPEVVATIPVGHHPRSSAITPDGTRLYVPSDVYNDVSVIDTASNTVLGSIPVGKNPVSGGAFIQANIQYIWF